MQNPNVPASRPLREARRHIGTRSVSALGMGCWAIGGPFWAGEQPLGWGEVDDKESIAALRLAVELGVDFFDTADVYGAGHSERVVGEALRPFRDQVLIASKFANTFDEESRQTFTPDASPGHIRRACEASLRRLGIERIDLYQFHWNDYAAEAIGPLVETLEALVREGKIAAYGWSTDFTDRIAAMKVIGPNCVTVQFEHNVLAGNPQMLPTAQELGITAAINRGPLGMGLLTGRFTSAQPLAASDLRSKTPEWLQYFKDGVPVPALAEKLERIRGLLTADGRTLAQGALAWLLTESPLNLPIPGFRTREQVRANIATLDYPPLPAVAMREIAALLG
ncbi:aldo/keto reductase [Niveibacterium sp. SC-1]|uniref:aldo/keto reductase n=1 Tax=Niveibacterium sp. SC-1 TaxID=3135646 RepID=UPI00311E5319